MAYNDDVDDDKKIMAMNEQDIPCMWNVMVILIERFRYKFERSFCICLHFKIPW